MSFPIGIVEVFVKNKDGARLHSCVETFKNLNGRGIDITIDMDKCDRPGDCIPPLGNCVPEPALMQNHVIRDAGHLASSREGRSAKIEPAPSFWQTFKTVKAVNARVGPSASVQLVGDISNRATGEDAKFEIVARNGRLRKRVI